MKSEGSFNWWNEVKHRQQSLGYPKLTGGTVCAMIV